GADTGNMNIYSFYKEAVGDESGSESVSLGGNNVAWAAMLRFSKTGGTWNIADATAKDTSGGNVSLAFADPGVRSGDLVLGAMAVPTDAASFDGYTLSQPGITWDTVTETHEPATSTGNDLGGFITVTRALDGSSTGPATLADTSSGTTTIDRGPGLFLRPRRASPLLSQPPVNSTARVT